MLYTLKKLASRWYVLLSLFGLLILVSCHRREISRTASHPNWSGQQLFKGLFLMDGPVADRIATYTILQQKYHFDQQPELKLKLARLGDQFVKTIGQCYPGFFADFQRNIQSGDHLQVEAAMIRGNEMLQFAIQQDSQLSPYYAQGMEIASKVDLAQVTDAQGHLDEAKLNAVAAQYRSTAVDSKSRPWIILSVPLQCGTFLLCAVVTWKIVYVFFSPNSNPNAQAGLQREMVIQEITDQLSLYHAFDTQKASL